MVSKDKDAGDCKGVKGAKDSITKEQFSSTNEGSGCSEGMGSNICLSHSDLAWDLKPQGFPSCIPLWVYREMSTEREI